MVRWAKGPNVLNGVQSRFLATRESRCYTQDLLGSTFVFVVLRLLAFKVHAADIPYKVLILGNDANFRPIIGEIDLELGTQRLTPSVSGLVGPYAIATEAERTYLVGGFFLGGDVLPFGEFDWKERRWTVTQWASPSLTFPGDLDVAPGGKLYAGDESPPVFVLDRESEQAESVSSFPILAGTRPLIDNDDRRVEVDALGSILWDTFRADDDTTVIVREHSDGVIVDRFDVGVRLNDFVLETESVLLGAALGDGKLYRVNLDSGITDLIFESDLLSQTQKIAIDPAGRVLALTRPVTNGLQAGGQVVRLDLVTGDTEVIGLDDGIFNPSDMNLLVIPEPPSMLLALIASLLIAFRHVAKHRGFAR